MINRIPYYSHAFFTWVAAKHGLKAGRPAGLAAAVGTVLPDIPAIVATVYYVGPSFLSEGWAAMYAEGVIEDIYFTGLSEPRVPRCTPPFP